MRKTILNHCLSVGLGVLIGLSVGAAFWHPNQEVHPLTIIEPAPMVDTTTENTKKVVVPSEKVHTIDSWALLQTAFLTMNALESEDYSTLASIIHKEKGVRFTPFSTVNLECDLVLSSEAIKNIESDSEIYSWGLNSATGSTILMPISTYIEKFVTPLAYSKAPHLAIDSVLLHGNALENVAEAYPGCRFIDFSFRSIDPDLNGSDWSSLKLVFEVDDNAWYLVGVVHSEWTL